MRMLLFIPRTYCQSNDIQVTSRCSPPMSAELQNHGANRTGPTSELMQRYFAQCAGAENVNQYMYARSKNLPC